MARPAWYCPAEQGEPHAAAGGAHGARILLGRLVVKDVKRAARRLITMAPLRDRLRAWVIRRRDRTARLEWERSEGLIVPSPSAKQQTLRSYAQGHRLKVFVETGTYYGDTVEALKDVFDRIYSIELSTELYEQARLRFADEAHIQLICGDSSVELRRIMGRLDRPALFWLDGHYSGGVTAQGEKDTPILEELACILDAPDRGHVIVIDDARCFGRDRDFPTIEELSDLVRSKRAHVDITVWDDSIRITPDPRPGQLPPTPAAGS